MAAGGDVRHVKLILMGEGGEGKTMLLRRLRRPDAAPGETTRTDGVEVCDWSLPGVELRCYDCGGQKAFQLNASFFATDESIVLLVHNLEKNRGLVLSSWFDLLRAMLPREHKVTIIPVLTECRAASVYPLEFEAVLERAGLTGLPVDSATGFGIAALIERIRKAALSRPPASSAFLDAAARVRELRGTRACVERTELGASDATLGELERAGLVLCHAGVAFLQPEVINRAALAVVALGRTRNGCIGREEFDDALRAAAGDAHEHVRSLFDGFVFAYTPAGVAVPAVAPEYTLPESAVNWVHDNCESDNVIARAYSSETRRHCTLRYPDYVMSAVVAALCALSGKCTDVARDGMRGVLADGTLLGACRGRAHELVVKVAALDGTRDTARKAMRLVRERVLNILRRLPGADIDERCCYGIPAFPLDDVKATASGEDHNLLTRTLAQWLLGAE